jgi:hypothetical protein
MVAASVLGTTAGETRLAVTWIDAEAGSSPVDRYNVWVTRGQSQQSSPTLVSATAGSPAVFSFQPDAANACVVYVQTVLRNGQSLALSDCPTTTIRSQSPLIAASSLNTSQVFVDGLTLTNNTPASNVTWSACTVYYQGTAYAISGDHTTGGNGFIYWTVASGAFTQAASFTPSKTIFPIATNVAGTGDTAWNKLANTGVQDANVASGLNATKVTTGTLDASIVNVTNVNASNISTGTLNAARIAAAALDATKLNIRQIIVAGMTLTNNSPSANKIAWSACSVYYDGTAYSVSSGNSGANTEQYVYWTVGGGSFTSAASFTPSATVFLIATNAGGVADVAWNKIAAGGIVSSHMNLASLLDGPNGTLSVSGLVLTDNSPGAGSVAWTASTVVYKGVTYAVSSGNTANPWICWKLASPTAFSTSAGFPTLGSDDFIVFENSSGVSLLVALEEANAEGRLVIHPGGVSIYNDGNHFASGFARTSGSSAAGILRLADGTDSGSLGSGQKIIATGSDGKIQMGTFEINRSNASIDPNWKNLAGGSIDVGSGNFSVDSIKVLVDGVARKIPVY